MREGGPRTSRWSGFRQDVVFAALPSTNQIVVFREDPNSGVLTTLLNSPFTSGLAPEAILLHPSGKYLYVANSAEDNI